MFPFGLFLDVFNKDDKLFEINTNPGVPKNIAIGTADQFVDCFDQTNNLKNHTSSPPAT